MTESLDFKIAKKMAEIRKRRIYQRVRAILDRFGTYKVLDQGSSWTKEERRLEVKLGGDQFILLDQSHGMFHGDTFTAVWVNGKDVVRFDKTADKKDERLVLVVGKTRIAVEQYESGPWASRLTLRAVQKALKPKPIIKKPSVPQPFREPDRAVADRLGIPGGGR